MSILFADHVSHLTVPSMEVQMSSGTLKHRTRPLKRGVPLITVITAKFICRSISPETGEVSC